MATISSSLRFQDEMSSKMESLARKLDMAATEAKIAKGELDALENAQKQWKITLNQLENAQVKDKDAIAKAREEYLKALNAYDNGVLKVMKYENQMASLEQQMNKNTQGFESMSGKIVTLSAAFQLFNQAKAFISGVNAKINEYIQYTETQMQAEDQLAIITKQRMLLNNDEIRSLYDLAAAQQRVGVVGDEATIAAMSGIAAFVTQKSSIEALTPVMDDLAVKMYGYDVNASNMEAVSKALGKAMQGDVGQLSRMGIKINEVTKKRLMSLKEEERAIELARIIKSVTGDMNEEMAKTPFGQITQAQNRLGDSYEKLGAALLPLQANFIETWSNLVSFVVDKIDTIVPLALTAFTVIGGAFIALRLQAFLTSKEMTAAALTSIKNWWAVAAPFVYIIGTLGIVSLTMKALGVDFRTQAENILTSINWIITAVQNLIAHIENIGIAIHNAFSKDKWEFKKIKANDFYTNQAKAQRQMQSLSGGALTNRALIGKQGTDIAKFADGNALKTKQQGDIGIKEEDMELLHDLATRDFMLNYQQLTPQITIPGMVIHEEADVNQVIDRFASAVTELVDTNLSLNEGSLAA